MHYFHNLSSAFGGFAARPPPGLYHFTPLGDFRSQTPNLSTHGKNHAGAHVYKVGIGLAIYRSRVQVLPEHHCRLLSGRGQATYTLLYHSYTLMFSLFYSIVATLLCGVLFAT